MKNILTLLTALLLVSLDAKAFDSGTAYTLQLVSNNCYLYLDNSSNSGSSETAASYTDTATSTFYLKASGSGYTLCCAESGLYMGYNSSYYWNASATSSGKTWSVTSVSDDEYYIKSRYGYLGLGNNGDNGKIYTDCKTATLWKIVPAGSGGGSASSPTTLVINEIMAANLGEAQDPSYNFGAWVELYNPTDTPASLTGVVVADGDGNTFTLDKYHGTVPAGGFKNLWFDHYSADNTHYSSSYKTYRSQVDMSLDCDGGSLSISYGGTTLDAVTYPEAISRCSWARMVDGGDTWSYCAWPSNEKTNAGNLFSSTQLAAPVADRQGGRFSSTTTFSVDIPTGTRLCYTTDGSVPTKDNGNVITDADSPTTFNVTATTCYRLRLISDNCLPSRVVTMSFIKNAPENANILSVVTNDKYLYDNTIGIYVQGTNNGSSLGGWSYWQYANYFQDWDRPANVELYEGDDNLFIDQEVNMAISGAKSRTNTHKSFKLKTGKAFNGLNFYQTQNIFARKPYNRYKDILIRAGGETDYYRHIDNTLQKVLIASGVYVDAQDYRPVEVYLNGVDKGLFFVRETTNKQFGASNYGMDTDAMDTFEENDIENLTLNTGTWDAFNLLYDTSEEAATDDAAWAKIRSMLDVDEYINYFSTETYLYNGDWPQNNFKLYRDYEDGRFHAVVQDLDWASYNSSSSPFTHIENQRYSYPYAWIGSQENRLLTIFLNLMNRPEFARQFVDAYCLMAGSVYQPDFVDEKVAELQTELAPYYPNDASTLSSTLSSIKSIVSSSVQQTRISQLQSWSAANLSSATKISASISSTLPRAAILLNGLPIPRGTFSSQLFLPVTLEARGPRGYKFVGWTLDGNTVSTDATLTLTKGGTYQAVYEPITTQKPAPVVINEVGADTGIYINDLLKRTDWIELYNTTDAEVSTEGMFLSDDIDNPQKYALPAATIPAHGYKVVWADKKSGPNDLHCNFKLGNDSNSVVILTASDGTWADSLYYHPQTYRQSVGRFPDGGKDVYLFDVPTIEHSNLYTSYATKLDFDIPASQPTIADVTRLIRRMLDNDTNVTLDDVDATVEKILHPQ